jgi:hypothetical protein
MRRFTKGQKKKLRERLRRARELEEQRGRKGRGFGSGFSRRDQFSILLDIPPGVEPHEGGWAYNGRVYSRGIGGSGFLAREVPAIAEQLPDYYGSGQHKLVRVGGDEFYVIMEFDTVNLPFLVNDDQGDYDAGRRGRTNDPNKVYDPRTAQSWDRLW